MKTLLDFIVESFLGEAPASNFRQYKKDKKTKTVNTTKPSTPSTTPNLDKTDDTTKSTSTPDLSTPAGQAKAANLKSIPGTYGLWSPTGTAPATHTTKNGEFKPVQQQDDPDSKEPKPATPKPKNPTTKVNTQQPALEPPEQKSTKVSSTSLKDEYGSELVNSNLKQIKNRSMGISGQGGPRASQGESLFANFATIIREKGLSGIIGSYEKRKDFVQFSEHFSQDKFGRTDIKGIRSRIAADLGFDSYDDTNPAHKNMIVDYLAARETYTKDQFTQANKIGPNHVFLHPSGFGGDETAYRNWVHTSFDGAIRLQGDISLKRTKIDPASPWFVIQRGDDAASPDKVLKKMMKTELQQAIKTNNSNDEQHYKYQLDLFKKFKNSDTLAIGKDENGRLTALHISNKLQGTLNDPHSSSTPVAQTKMLVDQITSSGMKRSEQQVFIFSAVKVQKYLEKTVLTLQNTKQNSTILATKVPITNSMARLADSKLFKNRMNDVIEQSTNTTKGRFGWWLQNKHPKVKFKSLPTEQKLQLMQQFMKQPGSHYAKFTRIFIKMGEVAKKKSNLNDQGLDGVRTLKDQESSVIENSYDGVVKFLEKSDNKLRDMGWPKGTNGPHTQTYIQNVMNNLHLDTYIKNYDKDFRVAAGGHSINPVQLREKLAEIVGMTDIDLNSQEGKSQLVRHILDTARIDKSSGGILLKTKDGDCVIATDEYRTAGSAGKVSTKLGSCFRESLLNSKGGASGFTQPGVPTKTQEDFKDLVRSLAVKELEGINGNTRT